MAAAKERCIAKRNASFRLQACVMERIFFHRRKRPFFLLLFFGRAKKKKRNKLVGGVVGEGFAECLVLQPRVDRDYLGHVVDICIFDNMYFKISHFNRWSEYRGVLYIYYSEHHTRLFFVILKFPMSVITKFPTYVIPIISFYTKTRCQFFT